MDKFPPDSQTSVTPEEVRKSSRKFLSLYLTLYHTQTDQEVDPALGDDDFSVTSQSICSSFSQYQYENGRQFHAYHEGAYLLPNDETDQNRLDLLHHLFWKMFAAQFFAPIRNPNLARILDVGTGTGIWAIDIANRLPSALKWLEQISVRYKPIWIPPNCQFYVDNAEIRPWPFSERERIDFIHSRALTAGIADWPQFYAEAFRNLKPEGWIEIQDHQHTISSDDESISNTTCCQ